MASRQEIEAGRAFVRLFLKNDMSRQLVRALRAAQMKLRNFGRSATMAGRRIAMAGAAMTAPFALGMREFANFDAKMRDVSTMLDDPGEFMPGFRKGIKDMSVEFGKAKDDLATGLYDILSATVPPEQAMERLAAATKLAAAGSAEVGASVSVLNTLMETYGDSFRDAGDATDFLFAIVRRGRTNVSKLSEHMGTIISTTKAAGMSARDMGASVALLTRATGGTDTALVALRAISGTFLKPAAEGAVLWQRKFGDALDANTLKTLGMAGVLERLSTLDAGEVAKIFPNLRAIRGIFPAIAKMQGFNEDLQAMADRSGNVATAFKKIKGPLFFFWQGLEQVKNILLEVGKAIAEVIEPYVKPILEIGKAVEKWVKNNKGLVVAMAATAVGVTALGIGLMGLGVVAFFASAGLGALAGIVSAISSPLGFITALVVGGAVAWMRYSKSGKRAWASLKAAVLPIVETLKATIGGVKDALEAGNWGLAGKIAMAGLKLAILQGLSAIQEAFPETFGTILRVVGKIGDGIVAAWSKVTGFLTDQWNNWGKQTLDTVMGVATRIPQIWQQAVQGMANWMLEQSAKGGIMGKAMSKVLGVDMSKEQAETARLDRELGLGPTDVLADARKAVEDYTQSLVDNVAAIGGEAGTGKVSEGLDAFLTKLESGTGIADAAKELAALRKEAAKQRAEDAKAGAGGGPGAGVGGLGAVGGAAATAAPRGVALTATYSAAAARIAGYQPGAKGTPEEKTAKAVVAVGSKIALLISLTKTSVGLYERFLAGWKVA